MQGMRTQAHRFNTRPARASCRARACRRLVHWCGAQLQAPHRAVRELGFQPDHAGVFISRWHHGSPAHRYGLFALHWILEVRACVDGWVACRGCALCVHCGLCVR
jgi:hypothetical protein